MQDATLPRPSSILQFAFFILHSFFLLAAPAAAEVQLPELNPAEPIIITAQAGNQWQLGSYEVWVLRGNCVIQQGKGYARSREAVLWIDRAEITERRPHKVIAYLEGDVEVAADGRTGAPRLNDQTWLGRFFSSAGVEVRAAAVAGKPDVLPPIYWRGMERRSPEAVEGGRRPPVQQAQYTAPAPAAERAPRLTASPVSRPRRPGPPTLARHGA